MQARRLLFSALAIAALAGCMVDKTRVATARASAELGCPESETHVVAMPGGGYHAYGCYREVAINCMTTEHAQLFSNHKVNEVSCVSGEVQDHTAEVWNVPTPAKAKDPVVDELRLVLRSIPYRDCGEAGKGKLVLTMSTDGRVDELHIVEGKFDLPTTSCLIERFQAIRVDAFEGEPRRFEWGFDLTPPTPSAQ